MAQICTETHQNEYRMYERRMSTGCAAMMRGNDHNMRKAMENAWPPVVSFQLDSTRGNETYLQFLHFRKCVEGRGYGELIVIRHVCIGVQRCVTLRIVNFLTLSV